MEQPHPKIPQHALANAMHQPVQAALRGLVNEAGGLNYHFLAWRFRKTLWRGFHHQVHATLAAWAPQEQELVIVGPSAGWNLPEDFLARFERVIAIEPDPLARWLLRRRFPRVRWQMDATDYFTPHGALLWSDNLSRLFARYPTQAILFSEFLGQLFGLYTDALAEVQEGQVVESAAFVQWKVGLRAHLATRSYCTIHDRWVSSVAPRPVPPAPWPFSPDGPPPPALWRDPQVAFDPLTAALTPDTPQRLLLWQRLPARWHVMAAVWRNA
jgi:hypothetical protein